MRSCVPQHSSLAHTPAWQPTDSSPTQHSLIMSHNPLVWAAFPKDTFTREALTLEVMTVSLCFTPYTYDLSILLIMKSQMYWYCSRRQPQKAYGSICSPVYTWILLVTCPCVFQYCKMTWKHHDCKRTWRLLLRHWTAFMEPVCRTCSIHPGAMLIMSDMSSDTAALFS